MPLITPRKVMFSNDVVERIWDYTDKQLDMLIQESQVLRTTTLPEWTRILKGQPKEKTRDFPFPNASNLVVQLIATRVEQILSRIMAVYMVDPLWNVGALGDLPGQESDEQAKVLEQFLGDMAIDPRELNLFRQEELFFYNAAAYGTSFMYLPYQYITEASNINISGSTVGLNRADEFKTIIKKEGPVPQVIPIYRIYVSNKINELENARFIAREVPLTREAIEDRIAFGVWSKAIGERILANPDTPGATLYQSDTSDPKSTQNVPNEYDAIYKVYECFIKWTHDKKTYSMIAHYHKQTKSRASLVFNYFPKNELPLEDARFGYDADQYLGYGFIEMLEGYQQEVSQLHNNRLDNEAIRNNVTFRVNKNSELASTLKFYPGIAIPADEDEIEVLATQGAGAMDNAQSESLSTSMANERSGIDPAISGTGSGIVNNKRGIYSSQGTMAVLQQQNNRSGLRMMDARFAHVRIGRKLADMYAFMGAGNKLRRYGNQAEVLRKALDNIKQGELGLIIKPNTSSNNVESDRQNSILLQGLQDKYIATMNQLQQLLSSPQAQGDPNQVQWVQDLMFAENNLTRHIFRIFGHFDVDKLVPFPEAIKNARFQQQQQQAQQSSGQPGQQVAQPTQTTIPVFSGAGNGNIPVRPQ